MRVARRGLARISHQDVRKAKRDVAPDFVNCEVANMKPHIGNEQVMKDGGTGRLDFPRLGGKCGLDRRSQRCCGFSPLALLGLVLLFCSFSRLDYNRITLGMPATRVVERYGEPYSVKELGRGALEYCYIERVSMNQELVYENHYYLKIQDGVVVSKRFREERRQPFDQMYRPDPNYPHYP